MRIVRFIADGETRVGIWTGEGVRDVSETCGTVAEVLSRHIEDPLALTRDIENARGGSWREAPLLPPVDPVSTGFYVAANYHSHAQEAGLAAPPKPLLFTKPFTTLVGPQAAIQLPGFSQKMDYEAELVAVIGRSGRDIPRERAMDYVAGYSIVNDTTARDLQWTMLGEHETVDWFSSKCLDKSTPIGPWVVTRDEVPDPKNLRIRSWINGELRQDELTALMVRPIEELVSFISSRCALQPGDYIATGTPKGVGGFSARFLRSGDRVQVAIDGVGQLDNPVSTRVPD